jgi:hypothetical protein
MPRGLRRRSAEIMVSKPTGCMDVYLLCVLSGRGLWDELITRPEESYRLWYVVVCDLGTWWMRSHWTTGDCCAKNNEQILKFKLLTNLCFWAPSKNCGMRLLLSLCLSVCPPAWNNSATTGRIFMKFDIWVFFENFTVSPCILIH